MRAIRASREQQAALQQLQAQQLGAAMHERPPGTAQRSSYGSGLTHPEHDPKNSVMRSLIYGGDETGAGASRGPRVQPHQGERPLGVDPASAQARAFHEQQLARAFQSHGAAAFVQGNSALPPAGVSHPHARGAAPAQVTPPRAPPPGNEVAALRAQVARKRMLEERAARKQEDDRIVQKRAAEEARRAAIKEERQERARALAAQQQPKQQLRQMQDQQYKH